MATNLEKRQQGETFRMIDPPSLPTKPYSPSRFKFACMGLFAGLVLGVVSAGGAEFMDDRIYSEDELKKLLPVEIIGEIPPVVKLNDESKQKRRDMMVGWSSGAVLICMLAGTLFTYLKG
jgi:capsular polysaccharide biosynthesis protein